MSLWFGSPCLSLSLSFSLALNRCHLLSLAITITRHHLLSGVSFVCVFCVHACERDLYVDPHSNTIALAYAKFRVRTCTHAQMFERRFSDAAFGGARLEECPDYQGCERVPGFHHLALVFSVLRITQMESKREHLMFANWSGFGLLASTRRHVCTEPWLHMARKKPKQIAGRTRDD